jgi:hypothetical protein
MVTVISLGQMVMCILAIGQMGSSLAMVSKPVLMAPLRKVPHLPPSSLPPSLTSVGEFSDGQLNAWGVKVRPLK